MGTMRSSKTVPKRKPPKKTEKKVAASKKSEQKPVKKPKILRRKTVQKLEAAAHNRYSELATKADDLQRVTVALNAATEILRALKRPKKKLPDTVTFNPVSGFLCVDSILFGRAGYHLNYKDRAVMWEQLQELIRKHFQEKLPYLQKTLQELLADNS